MRFIAFIVGGGDHDAPALNTDTYAIEQTCQLLRQQIVTAANDALEDRKPAKMFITNTLPVNLNFVRHYVTAGS